MAKAIYCSDMGADCDFVARGETLEEVLKVGAEHGK
jgi:predicted small metal-binding protein